MFHYRFAVARSILPEPLTMSLFAQAAVTFSSQHYLIIIHMHLKLKKGKVHHLFKMRCGSLLQPHLFFNEPSSVAALSAGLTRLPLCKGLWVTADAAGCPSGFFGTAALSLHCKVCPCTDGNILAQCGLITWRISFSGSLSLTSTESETTDSHFDPA